MMGDNARDRIQKMKDIIREEAEDKARKIREQTSHQFNIEKNKILNQQKDKVIQEYKNKLEQHSVQRRIERSAKVGAARLKKMQARQDTILKIKEDTKTALQKALKDRNVYKEFIRKLIVQGLIRLMEREVNVRCRKQDVEIVQEVLDGAVKEFLEIIKRETNFEFNCKAQVDPYHQLKENQSELGGVILSAQFGTILCHNTIDARLDLCFQDALPDIRRILFPDA